MYKKIICVFLAAIVIIAVAVGGFATDPVSIVSKYSYSNGRVTRFGAGKNYDMTMTIENNTDDDADYALVATSYRNDICNDVKIGTPVTVAAGEQGTIVANISTVTGDTEIKGIVVKVVNGQLYPVNQTVSIFNSRNLWNG